MNYLRNFFTFKHIVNNTIGMGVCTEIRFRFMLQAFQKNCIKNKQKPAHNQWLKYINIKFVSI